MPNIDPRTLKNMMAKMGMQSSEIEAERVIIECGGKDIVITNPSVTRIVMQGTTSFQISGEVSESERESKVEISEGDIDIVAEKTGISDRERIRESLERSNGNIADSIIELGGS